MERLCLDCGLAFKGRSDKKFCDDNCRSNYNNAMPSERKIIIKNINAILRKNQLILDKLNPGLKAKVSYTKMYASGLNFDYFTHQHQTLTGRIYTFCYDIGYTSIDDKHFQIIRKYKN